MGLFKRKWNMFFHNLKEYSLFISIIFPIGLALLIWGYTTEENYSSTLVLIGYILMIFSIIITLYKSWPEKKLKLKNIRGYYNIRNFKLFNSICFQNWYRRSF